MSSPRSYGLMFMDPETFRNRQVPRIATKMLRDIVAGDADHLQRLAEAYPEAIFYEIDNVSEAGEVTLFSPLAFAMYARDEVALDIFQAVARKDGMLVRFLRCANHVEECINSSECDTKLAQVKATYARDAICQQGFFTERTVAREDCYQARINSVKNALRAQPEEIEDKKDLCALM